MQLMSTDTQIIPITSMDALEQLFTRSHDAPVLLFNCDMSCPRCIAAYQQVTRLGGDVALIDVICAKRVALALAERTGVKHESPQVILLRDGRAVWSASHYAITFGAVKHALHEYA
jgi:bacillithiol system protein YtxJ